MNLVTHCAPLLAATRHGASLVQPQVTMNCLHSSVGDEAYHCTPLHGSEFTDRHGLSHTPSIAFWHLPPNSARFSYATEGALFISAHLYTDAVSDLRKV